MTEDKVDIRALKSPARVAEDERIYTKADMEAACALVLAGFRSKPVLDKMVDRFLAWPLPDSVCTDPIATKQGPGRIGTNLLNATEARQMLEHVLALSAPESPAKEQPGEQKLGQGWIQAAWIEHHKGGDNLVWDQPGGKATPLYKLPPPPERS